VLTLSVIRAYHDIGIEHVVTTELSVAKVKEGKRQ
jgi:hypothetical protein